MRTGAVSRTVWSTFPLFWGITEENPTSPAYTGPSSNSLHTLLETIIRTFFVHHLAGKIIKMEDAALGTGEERYSLESDLAWLLGDYEEVKRDLGVYDEDDVISAVRNFLDNDGTPSFMEDTRIIVFDGFIHLSRIEEDILFHLFRRADEVWWLIDYDSRSRDPVGEFKDSSGREDSGLFDGKAAGKGVAPGSKEAYRIFAPLVSPYGQAGGRRFR